MFQTTGKSKRKNGSAGYTLIEVVLVMVFISLSFLSLFAIFARTIQGDTESRNEIIAVNLAQECIERTRNCRDNQVLTDGAGTWSVSDLETDCSGILSDATYFEDISNFESNGTEFNVVLDIDATVSDGALVACRVSWESFGIGAERRVEIRNLLTDWQKP